MARNSASGSKELISLFISKDIAKLLRDKAEQEHRKISAQAEMIFSEALQKGIYEHHP